jgi:hypothetical protein
VNGAARAACLLLVFAGLAQAQGKAPAPGDWRAEKCARYRAAWDEALKRFTASGLSDNFLTAHEAFLARGCEGPREVCPRSKEELAIANVMVLRAMNAGTASTFPPFACGR